MFKRINEYDAMNLRINSMYGEFSLMKMNSACHDGCILNKSLENKLTEMRVEVFIKFIN